MNDQPLQRINDLHEMLGKLIAYRNDKDWLKKAVALYQNTKAITRKTP